MITLNHLVKTYIQAKMEAMDAQRALEAVERLQAKLKDRGEAPTEEKLSLLKTVLQSHLFHQILNIQQTQSQTQQGNKLPHPVSVNTSLSTSISLGMRGLSHSDSYTWAQNNSYRELTSPGPDTDEEEEERGGGGCSPSTKHGVPQQKFGGSLCALNTHAENNAVAAKLHGMTQLCTPPRISRTMSMGRNLSDVANDKRHVEMIDLENDGKGLGFGIIGGRTSGIMVKTILPRGPAGLDKRLRSGDHLLRIGDTDLSGMDNEEVAQVLRNAGSRVKLLIARDVTVSTGNDLSLSVPLLPQLAQQQQRMTRMGTQLCDAGEDSEHSVQFSKNSLDLGFTVSSGQNQSGVFVKSIVKGSAVDQDNQIHIGDKILAVDGTSLTGFSELRALEVLRKTGQIVRLRLARRASGTGRQMSLREMSRKASMQRSDATTGVKLTDAEEEELRNRWQGALGLRYQVVVCQVEKFGESLGLGVSLEARAGHHYLCSVLPEGPVGQSGKIHPGDQILEVNGTPLIGESHRDVISVLRELPRNVVLVCCRIVPPKLRRGDDEEDEEEQVTLKELLSELNDMSQYNQPCCLLPGCNNKDCGNRGVKPVSPPLAMWERESQIIELKKGEEGLGFSILDYQDPENASKTVLVVRSLVPGGVTDRDGRLLPGDRLMSVNGVDLVDSTLERAVNLLKSSGYGPVRIGVAKPLTIECCVVESLPESLRSSRDEIRRIRDESDTRYPAGMLTSSRSQQAHANSYSSQQGNRLHFYKDDKSLRQGICGDMQASDKHLAPAHSFGGHFERTITVVRDNRNLGMTVSAMKDGSGVCVRSVIQGGCVSQDGRLRVGDAILAVNGEPTTGLNNARARAMLRHHSVRGPSMSVTFVPSSLVEGHRASLALQSLSSLCPPSPTPPSGEPAVAPFPPGTTHTEPTTGLVSPTRHLDSPTRPSRPVATEVGSVLSQRPPRSPHPDHSLIPKPPSLPVPPPKERPGVSVDGCQGDERGEEETGEETGEEMTGEEMTGEEVTGEEVALHRSNSLSWGRPRWVQLRRSPGQSLGISIMGGRGMGRRLGGGVVRGVFIKHISPDSPAGHNGSIHTGDRILEVGGVDLTDASHEEAVEAIRRAGDAVTFLVQTGPDRPPPSPVLTSRQRHTSHLDPDKVSESGLFPSFFPTNPFVPTPFKQATNRTTAVYAPETGGGTEDASWKKMMARYGSLPGELQMIELEKSSSEGADRGSLAGGPGLGLQLTGDRDGSRARLGIYVAGIDPQGPAGRDGQIRVGDELLEINGQILYGRSPQNATFILNKAPARVKIILTRNSSASVHSDWLDGSAMTHDLLSCPIMPGVQNTIEICKGHTGLGLSIVGGCDTLLGAILIHEVNDGGAAQRDGRLLAGDQILEVNGIDLRQATHEEAIGILRLTPQKLCLTVFRHQQAYREEDLWDVFHVELRSRPGRNLGLRIVGKSNDTGVFVSEILRGGVLEEDGRLFPGDQILSINREDVRAASQEHVTMLLETSETVTLEVARFKAGVHYSMESQSGDSVGSDSSTLTSTTVCDVGVHHQGETLSRQTGGSYSFKEHSEIRTVVIHKGPGDSLGLGVAGGVGSPQGDLPLFIASIAPTGLAARTHLINVGEYIVSINHVSSEGMSHQEAGELLNSTRGPVTLQVQSPGPLPEGRGGGQEELGQGNLGVSSTGGTVYHNNRSPQVYQSITLKRGALGLGFSVIGGFGSPHGDLPIYVKTIFGKGAAIEDGRLQRGDQILAVNGHSLEGVTHADAVAILKRTRGTVVLTVLS
ncbi:hypothetical protein DPEC_G00181200 [Dallia pectoralis]|uniref:Uncharacterized protein n=1 Tax=Dallia pectoralis TaxID=75939 RepID=A0ACC2GA88_DALPE|nr:hypothetical protein DPEC_G00181200 [Dallia pectoralis]